MNSYRPLVAVLLLSMLLVAPAQGQQLKKSQESTANGITWDEVPALLGHSVPRTLNTPSAMYRAAKSGSSFDQIQALPTSESRGTIYPELLQLDNGDVLAFYKMWGDFPSFAGPPRIPTKLFMVRSGDSGSTWGEPQAIAEGQSSLDFSFVSAAKTADGRILVYGMNAWEIDTVVYSDDEGTTWQTRAPVSEDISPSIHGQFGGRVFKGYADQSRYEPYIQSSEDGETWGDGVRLAQNVNTDRYRFSVMSLTELGDGSLVALYSRFDLNTGVDQAFTVASSDGGATWGTPSVISASSPPLRIGDIAYDDNSSTLWVVGQSQVDNPDYSDPFSYRSDVYLRSSTDGGATWSGPQAFTSYPGDDFTPNILAVEEGILVAFSSERYYPGSASVGLFGVSTEDETLPVMAAVFWPFEGNLSEGETGIFSAALAATAGIESARVLFDDGGNQTSVDLTKNDADCEVAGFISGICWSAEIGPFAFSDSPTFQILVSGNGGEEVLMGEGILSVAVSIAQGDFSMPLGLQGWISGLEWKGDDYLFTGSFWATKVQTFQPFADDYAPDTDIERTAGPGLSDRDIQFGYINASQGLAITQRTYTWQDAARQHGAVMEFEISNQGELGDATPLRTGMYLDVDMANGDLYWDDVLAYNADDRILYMYDSGNLCLQEGQPCPAGWVGLAIAADDQGADGLTRIPGGANHYADGDPAWSSLGGGVDPEMAGGAPLSPDDRRMVLGAREFALPVDATSTVAMAIAMGESYAEIKATLEALVASYKASVVSTEDLDSALPTAYRLEQNYPNPFNPTTSIEYALPQAGQVSLSVYNVLGERVATLVNASQPSGTHQASWNASGLASGVYMYRLEVDGAVKASRQLILMK